jgi:hypothetical protein
MKEANSTMIYHFLLNHTSFPMSYSILITDYFNIHLKEKGVNPPNQLENPDLVQT